MLSDDHPQDDELDEYDRARAADMEESRPIYHVAIAVDASDTKEGQETEPGLEAA